MIVQQTNAAGAVSKAGINSSPLAQEAILNGIKAAEQEKTQLVKDSDGNGAIVGDIEVVNLASGMVQVKLKGIEVVFLLDAGGSTQLGHLLIKKGALARKVKAKAAAPAPKNVTDLAAVKSVVTHGAKLK